MKRWRIPRLRFSLRTFLVLICIIGALLGLSAHRIERGRSQWAKIVELERLGVKVGFANVDLSWMPGAESDMSVAQAFIDPDLALRLNWVQFTERTPAPKAFELLREFPAISVIRVGGQEADDRIVDELVRHQNMEYLDLAEASITDAGLARIAELPKLRSVYLPAGIGDEGLKHISALPNLHQLWGRGGPITDDGVRRLQGMTGLLFLGLSETQITDEGVRHLAGMTRLIKLDLSGTRVTGQCAAQLTGFKQLQQLNLSNTRFDDPGMPGLCSLPNLIDLNLADTDVTDSGMVFLRIPHVVTRLDLSHTWVTADGLANLNNCHELNYLHIRGLPVSDADADVLAKVPMLLELDCQDTGITSAFEQMLLEKGATSTPRVRY